MSFWESATSAIQTFSSTLDKLDRTVGDPGSGDEAPDESDEMAACRVMLERAQMDIVQISQQSRVLLAEKEASINMWRQKYLESTGNIEPADMSSLIDMEALLTERNALLSNLSSLEDKLKEAHAQQSGPLIKAQMYDNLVTKHAKLAEEYASMVSDVESKSRGESDTIEHLVSEYTNLGAEFERRQATDAARIHEVERENEVLTMKLLAMEHSITEFADRASTSTASPSAASSGEYAVLQNDAKELRAKLVNLQFDLKEKEDEIGRLKTVIDDAGSAVVLSSALSEKDFNELRAEFEAIRADYFKAVAERDEAEAVGKAALSESEKMQHEIKRLNEILEASDKCDNEMSRLREEVSVLVNDLDDKVAQCSSYEEEVKNLKASKSVMLHEMDKTKADFADSIACIEQTKCLLEQAVSKHNIEFSEVESKLSSADETITGLRCRIEEIEAAHKAEISNTSVSDTEILQRIERAVLLERNKHVAEMENALNNLRVELEDSCVLMIQQKHDELTASSSRNLKDLKISSDVEKNEAILKITTEFDARLENCLADQRQELNSIHSDAIAQKIEELQTQFQRTMGEKIDEVKLSLAEEYSLSMRLQKEDDNRLLQEACEKVREELTRNLAGDSEEKVAAMTAEFSSRLDAAILKERVESEHLLVTAVQKQRNEDEELKIKAVEDAVATMKRNMENAEREKLQALRDELQFELASTVKGLQQAAAADLLVSLQKQVDEDKADCQRAIDNLRIELENIHATVLAKALADSELEHAAAIDGEKAIAEANLSSAVQKQQAEDEKIKESALTSLKAVHVAELESTLSKAGQELRAAVALEKENGRLAIEKCATEWAARVDEKEQALLVLKEELKSMQHDFDRKLQIEIDVISRQKDIEKAREIAEIRTETDATVAKAKAEREEYLTLYTKEYKQRKLIHNKLLEIQGNIRVMCRVRPVLEVERRMAADVDVTEIPNEDTIIIHRDVATKNRYEFDQVFSPSSTQEQVFEAVQPLVISVLDGYNVCIFACKYC